MSQTLEFVQSHRNLDLENTHPRKLKQKNIKTAVKLIP